MKEELAFLFEHTRLGFCWLDLIALIILLAVIVIFIVKIIKQKREEKELEDEISNLTADASVDSASAQETQSPAGE